MKNGYVYFIRSNDTGLLKIGRTQQEVSDRAYTLSYQVKQQLVIEKQIAVSDCHTVEKVLHLFFDNQRVTGEWFAVTLDDVNAALTALRDYLGELDNFTVTPAKEKRKSTGLTGLGQLINEAGLALPFIIEKSGINRNRLVYLRTNPNAVLSLGEAQLLAPLFRMTLDEFAVKLAELQPQAKSGEKQ